MGAWTLAGAHCKMYVNGQPFARVATFSFTATTTHRDISVVDTLDSYELAPTGTKVLGQMVIYRLHKDGGAEGAGMKAPPPDLARQKYFSLLLLDRLTDTVVFRADQCVVQSETWNFAKGLVTGTVSIQGQTWGNEVEATSPTAR